jgi:DNA-binding MarR family transcriptional regulator
MADIVEKHQLAAKLFEFSSLQHLADEQAERHSPVFRGQNKILVALSEKDNLPQKDLAQQLDMSVQSVGEFITKLQKKDLVTKTKSPTDGRVQLIQLTDKGRREAEKSLFYIPDYLDYLTPEEWRILDQLLEKMNTGIRNDLQLDGIQNLGTRLLLGRLDRQTQSDQHQ